MVLQPASCQMLEDMYMVRKAEEKSMKFKFAGAPRNWARVLISPPVGERNILSIPQSTITEIKCGAYITVWVTRWNFLFFNWFIKRDSTMGIGKVHSML